MFQIDVSTAATTQPASTAAGTPGFFTDGNPATGVAATVLPAEFMNTLMLEMLNVVKAAGITPSKAAFNQLATAIKGLSQQGGSVYGADTGAANIYAVAYDPAVTALTDGMVMRFAAKTANTGASTFSPNGVTAKPILTPALAPLAGGEIITASICTVVYSTSQAAWILLHATGGAQRMAASALGKADMNAAVQGSYTAYNGYDSDAATYNWPVLASGSSSLLVWWNVHTYGVAGSSPRKFQIASQAFTGSNQGRTFMRQLHDSTWSSWRELVTMDTMQSFGLGASAVQVLADADSKVTKPGWYQATDVSAGTVPTTYGIVLVSSLANGGSTNTWANQMFFGTNGKVYWRNSINLGAWSAWREYAFLDSPTFTGDPKAPTPTSGDSDTSISTTAFVQNAVKGFTYKDISGSASVTLTAAEAGVGVIVLQGAITANISVILPAAGQWIITNRTSGNFLVSVCGGAADGGIQVASGKNAQVWSNGSYAFLGNSDPHGWARFTSSGSWTCPAGVTTVWVSGCGGGGGGAGGAGYDSNTANGTGGGSGGGAGIAAVRMPVTVVPGTTYAVTVGAAGAAGTSGGTNAAGGAGTAGGATSLGSIVALAGGVAGVAGNAAYGAGGISSGGGASDGGDGQTPAKGGNGGSGGGGPFGTAGGGGRAGNNNGTGGKAGAGFGTGGGGGGGGYYGSSGTGGAGSAGMPGFLFLEW